MEFENYERELKYLIKKNIVKVDNLDINKIFFMKMDIN